MLFEDMPILAFDLILNELSYEDQFNLGQTCEKFNSIVKERKREKLFIFINFNPYYKQLFEFDELIYYQNSLSISNLKIMENMNFKIKFKNLKKLALIFKDYRFGYANLPNHDRFLKQKRESKLKNQNLLINLNDLNYYEELEFLEINEIYKLIGEKLTLKNLRILFVKTRLKSDFEIESDQLEILAVLRSSRPKLINEQKKLSKLLINYGKLPDTDKNYLIEIGSKAKCLSTIQIELKFEFYLFGCFLDDFQYLDSYLLSLEEIKLNGDFFFPLYFENDKLLRISEIYFEPKNIKLFFNEDQVSIDQFINLIEHLKTFDIDDYFFCVDTYYDGTKYDNELLMNNANNTEYATSIKNKKVLHIGDQTILNKNLIEEIKNLECLDIKRMKIIDKNYWELMFNNFKLLSFLHLELTFNLELEFYNRMPYCFPNLRVLWIHQASNEFENRVEFLSNLKNLELLICYLEITKKEFIYIFKNCKKLVEFHLIMCSSPDKNNRVKCRPFFIEINRNENEIKNYKLIFSDYIGFKELKQIKFNDIYDLMDYLLSHVYFNKLFIIYYSLKNLCLNWKKRGSWKLLGNSEVYIS